MIPITSAAICYTALFIIIELSSRKFRLHKELSRKLAHIIAGTTAALLPLALTFGEIMVLSALFLPVMALSKRKKIFTSIHEVKRKTYGELYFPISIFICAWLFHDTHTFMFGILIMGISDGFASLFGQRYGKKTYRVWQGRKSYVGSLAFFLVTLIIGIAVVPSLGLTIVPISAVLTLIEASLSGGTDNLVLSPAGCILVLAASRLI